MIVGWHPVDVYSFDTYINVFNFVPIKCNEGLGFTNSISSMSVSGLYSDTSFS